MADTSVKNEIPPEDVVNESILITILSRHHEQLLRDSTIWLASAIIGHFLSIFGLVVFILLILTDRSGTSANLLILLRASVPFLFSAGLTWQYDRQQRRAMEVALQLSKERKLERRLYSARMASFAIQNDQARDAAYGRMVEHLITEPEETATMLDLGIAKKTC